MVKNGYFLFFSVDFIRIPQISQNVITLLAMHRTGSLSWNYYNSFLIIVVFVDLKRAVEGISQNVITMSERDM